MKKQFTKILLTSIGILCVLLGSLGILLPLLPTTPFLLVAVFCFAKASKRLNHWLLHHKILGKYIYNYTVHKAIPLRAKITAILMLWTTMILSMVIADELLVTTILILIASAVTIHLLLYKTLSEDSRS